VRVPWKLIGVAGLAGVAATGAVVARKRRAQHDYDPDELRDRLHRRLGEIPRGDKPVRLWLARHGETDENTAGRILGRRDPPLSAAGVAQADALARRLRDKGLAAVWTSPLERARGTAEVVAQALGLEAETLEGLVESDRGDWEGRLVAELALESPPLHAAFLAGEPSFRFPGGESLGEQRARTRSALETVSAGPLPALVVAHAGTIRAALADSGANVPAESALAHGALVELLLRSPG
jgi:broad specificity phosphatase PhoE